jgi:hypothetical protein
VSLQVAILKVLSSYPDGRASLEAMKADLAILAGAGPDWRQQLKRLAAKAPNLDIFSQGLVSRDSAGWTLNDAGREALRMMETQPPARIKLYVVEPSSPVESAPPPQSVELTVGLDDRPRRRRKRPLALSTRR